MEPDDLYGLALDRFVAERRTLAAALRKAGRRDEAAGVASQRKPSVAAWAVNQLVRTQARDVQALFDAGDALREAQSQLLAGRGDGRALRAAGNVERAAVDHLVDAARGLLTSDGGDLSSTVIERVAGTLHAAALDEGAREQLRGGRLVHELRHVGLGLGESVAEAPPAPPVERPTDAGAGRRKGAGAGPKQASGGSGDANAELAGSGGAEAGSAAARAADEAARADAEAARAEEARVKRARKAARTAHAAARRAAERATRAVETAERQRGLAAGALREADEALAAARSHAAAVDAALERAQADLDDV